MPATHVSWKNAGSLMLYALSTCPWCKKVKALLEELGVEYDFIDVDLLRGKEREDAISTVRKWNPGLSFPVLVIDNAKSINGFREEEIRGALKK